MRRSPRISEIIKMKQSTEIGIEREERGERKEGQRSKGRRE